MPTKTTPAATEAPAPPSLDQRLEDWALQHAPELASLWKEQLGLAECDGAEISPQLLEQTGALALRRLGLATGVPRLWQLALEQLAAGDARLKTYAHGRKK